MPQLIKVVRLNDPHRPVVGLTSVDSRRLFVLRAPSEQKIAVYETTTFKLQTTLNVNGLRDDIYSTSNGLTSCAVSNCLYVSDSYSVYKIELTGDNQIFKWPLDGSGSSSRPPGLSINAACNLLVTCDGDDGDKKLLEYTSSGSLVREIRLESTMSPRHAIQLTSDQFVVCTWPKRLHDNNVVEVNSQGQVVVSYKNQLQSTTRHHFNVPCHLAVNKNNQCIFVADKNNKRVVMLSHSLKCALELNASLDGSRLQAPHYLHLNQSNSLLYVSEWKYDGSIFLFDIRRRH